MNDLSTKKLDLHLLQIGYSRGDLAKLLQLDASTLSKRINGHAPQGDLREQCERALRLPDMALAKSFDDFQVEVRAVLSDLQPGRDLSARRLDAAGRKQALNSGERDYKKKKTAHEQEASAVEKQIETQRAEVNRFPRGSTERADAQSRLLGMEADRLPVSDVALVEERQRLDDLRKEVRCDELIEQIAAVDSAAVAVESRGEDIAAEAAKALAQVKSEADALAQKRRALVVEVIRTRTSRADVIHHAIQDTTAWPSIRWTHAGYGHELSFADKLPVLRTRRDRLTALRLNPDDVKRYAAEGK